MGLLSKAQLDLIEGFLDQQGLDFRPLRDELKDHLITDLETRLRNQSFEESWSQITSDIPENHFTTIQTETMNTLNTRFNLSRGLTYVSLALLFAATVFKILHLPLTGILLISSFGMMGAALAASVLSGILLNKEKKGGLAALGLVSGIILYVISWSFQILHFPGGIWMRTISVTMLSVFFIGLTIYFHQKSVKDSLLVYLHERHTPGIERFLLILLGASVVLRIAALYQGFHPSIFMVVLVLVIGGAGLQFFALNWREDFRAMESKTWMQVLLVVAFLAFIIPSLPGGMIEPTIRWGLAGLFYLLAGVIVIFRSDRAHWSIVIPATALSMLYAITWGLERMGMSQFEFLGFIYSPALMGILFVALFMVRKQRLLFTYLMMVLAHYLYFYPVPT